MPPLGAEAPAKCGNRVPSAAGILTFRRVPRYTLFRRSLRHSGAAGGPAKIRAERVDGPHARLVG